MHVRHRGQSAYVDGKLAYGDSIELMRLRHSRSATTWGFALYLANTDKYEDTLLPTSSFADTPEGALDYACGLYSPPRTSSDQTPDTTPALESTPEGLPAPTT